MSVGVMLLHSGMGGGGGCWEKRSVVAGRNGRLGQKTCRSAQEASRLFRRLSSRERIRATAGLCAPVGAETRCLRAVACRTLRPIEVASALQYSVAEVMLWEGAPGAVARMMPIVATMASSARFASLTCPRGCSAASCEHSRNDGWGSSRVQTAAVSRGRRCAGQCVSSGGHGAVCAAGGGGLASSVWSAFFRAVSRDSSLRQRAVLGKPTNPPLSY